MRKIHRVIANTIIKGNTLDELVVLGRGLPVELEVASGNLLPNGHKLAVGDLELRRYFIYLLPP